MADPEQPEGEPGVGVLQAEIVRLNKIVQALMDRAESSTNAQGSDFGLFQTTIMLQEQVRLRTEEVEAAFRDNERIAGGVQASAAGDMHTLRRTAALQIQLLELVVQQKDVGELIDRVATLLDMPIVLFDTRGHELCSSRAAADSPDLSRRLWAAYARLRGSPGPLGTVENDDGRIYYRDVLVMGRVERVLAGVASLRQPTEFADATLSFLQQLVTLDVLRHRDELRMRRRVRRGLLRDILAGGGAADELRIRLLEQGFDGESVLRIAVVEPKTVPVATGKASATRTGERLGTKLLRGLDAVLSQRRIPFLSLSMDSLAVVLVTLSDAEIATARTLLADLQEAATRAFSPEPVVVGCSAPLVAVAGAPRSLQQAKAACMAARRAPAAGGAAIFDELSGQFRLLDGLDEKALTDIVQRTFAPLFDYDAQHRASLFETVRTLFEHHLAVQETADVLHIHRNTLQKRLTHVEHLLAIDLSELDDIVDIRLGLRAADLLDKRLP
jgi:DNA-binding PucR family transcriptional regulator